MCTVHCSIQLKMLSGRVILNHGVYRSIIKLVSITPDRKDRETGDLLFVKSSVQQFQSYEYTVSTDSSFEQMTLVCIL